MSQSMKTLMEQYIAQIQKIYGSHLRKVILYGSYARGDFGPDSNCPIRFECSKDFIGCKRI